MKKASFKALFAAFGLAMTGILGACNSSDTEEYDAADMSGVAVTAFKLQADKDILENLDSVFFSIDLVNARIFNADSLPQGTDIDSLAVTISTDQCSVCEFSMVSTEGKDTVIDYLTNPDAKLNFTKPVTLKIVSSDNSAQMVYSVKVNVHELMTDSLWWNDLGRTSLPGNPTKQQRAVKMGDKAYILTEGASGMQIFRSEDVFNNRWTRVNGNLPADADLRSLCATDNTLYILDNSGALYESSEGSQWKATGVTGWQSITAAYTEGVTGLKTVDGRLMHVSYPAGAETEVSADFPVTGYSQSVLMSNKWSENDQVMIFGGRKASGALTGAAWSYDGSKWAKVGGGLPAGEGYAVSRYVVLSTDSLAWTTNRTDALVAIGGRTAEGAAHTVYVSRDMGMTWKLGAGYLQLPTYIPAIYGADLLTFEYTQTDNASRAVKPITSWEVPVLLLFGGRDNEETFQPYYWQGTINGLRFKPLQ